MSQAYVVLICAFGCLLPRILPLFCANPRSVWIQRFLHFVPVCSLVALIFPAFVSDFVGDPAGFVAIVTAGILAWYNLGVMVTVVVT